MRIIGIVAVMLILVSVSSGYWWDTEKILQGQQMIKTGAPWFGDDAKMYFGDSKDASIFYNSTSGAAEVVGLTAVNNLSIEMETGEDITFVAGDSKMDLSLGTGIFKTPSGAVTIGPGDITMSGDLIGVSLKNITLSGAGGGILSAVDVTASGNVNGTDLYISDDALITDDLVVDGTARVDEGLTVNAFAVNTTATATGLMSANGGLAVGVNASTTINTLLTSSSTKTVYDMDASSGNVTLTLPDAATVPGRMYFISVSGDPGANYARITATGGDDINANNYLVSTEQWSTAVIVASNGAYRALTSGNWTAQA